MIINDKRRIKIKKYLPKNYAKVIAEQCGVSEAQVYKVLAGFAHKEVAQALIDLAEKTKSDYQKLAAKANRL